LDTGPASHRALLSKSLGCAQAFFFGINKVKHLLLHPTFVLLRKHNLYIKEYLQNEPDLALFPVFS
jgi:hypothetical protein